MTTRLTVPVPVVFRPAELVAPVPLPQPGSRIAILESVVFAAASFLKCSDLAASVPLVLERLGNAADVSRAYVYENYADQDGVIRSSLRYEWVAAGFTPEIDNPELQGVSLSESGFARWEQVLGAGGIIHGAAACMPVDERALLSARSICTLTVVPVMVDSEWWGFIGLDDCRNEGDWAPAELDALRAAADMFGATLSSRRVQQAMRDAEDRFHRLVEATVEGIVIHDGATVIDANPSFAEMIGYPLEGIIGRDPFDFLAPETHEMIRAHQRTRYGESYETTGLHRDGTRFPVELKGTTIEHAAGSFRVVSIRNLTNRKRAETELLESQRMLQTLMSNLPGMAYRCRNDDDWTMDFVSEGALALTGYTPDELIASRRISYGDVIHADDRAGVQQAVEDAIASKAQFRMVYRIQPASGPEKWVWEQGRAIVSATGELLGLEGFVTDVTEARQAEETGRQLLVEQTARAAAESSEFRAELLAEASRILSVSFDYQATLARLARVVVPALADYCTIDVVDADGRVERLGAVHIDPAREHLLLGDTHVGERGVITTGALRTALSQKHSTLVRLVRDSTDELQPGSVITVPLVVAERAIGALTLTMSVSGRRYTAEDLALAEEMARRAALAIQGARLYHDAQRATEARDHVLAVVAHDLRNPLHTVLMAADVLLEIAPVASQRPQLDVIVRSARGMDRLIQDLLDITRIERGHMSLQQRPEDAGAIVTEAMAMLRPLASARSILLECDVEPGLPAINADSARLIQVISNLVGNAIKFSPVHGRITFVCSSAVGEVRFGVTDAGPGIAPDQIPHVFGGFWQGNKADRRGIGLGLSIAKGIVDAHAGRIWVECEPGPGSTFYFTIPTMAPPPSPARTGPD